MADLISKSEANGGVAPVSNAVASVVTDDGEALDFIELLFFAYRDFVHDPDSILEEFGFGRAHHRVLHFVCRNPGMRVARLLNVLNITKQSLARVLRQLIADGFIEQRTGESDRRERRLFLTDAGADLVHRLMEPQVARVRGALSAAGDKGDDAVNRFLTAMITDPVATSTASGRRTALDTVESVRADRDTRANSEAA